MDSRSPTRSTRDRPAKPPLSRDVILEAALRLLRAEGLEAVTMRRIAAELDTGPASLYVYISGRGALRDALLDRVTGMIELEPPDPARWREQIHRLLHGLLSAMAEHPGIAQVAVAKPPTGEHTLLAAENLAGILRCGGIRDRDVAWACDILPLITTASAVEAAEYQRRGAGEEDHAEAVQRLQQAFATLPPERFPHLIALGPALTSGDDRDRFEFAVDVFLDGLVARAAIAPAGQDSAGAGRSSEP